MTIKEKRMVVILIFANIFCSFSLLFGFSLLFVSENFMLKNQNPYPEEFKIKKQLEEVRKEVEKLGIIQENIEIYK